MSKLADGSEIILTILGSTEIYGATAVYGPESRETTVTTLTDVAAVAIEREQLLVWMAERPEIRDQVLRLFAGAHKHVANRLPFLRERFGRREVGW